MGTTSNYSWPYPESSDYVADGATAIENLADAVDTTVHAHRGLKYLSTVPFSSGGNIIQGVFNANYENYRVYLSDLFFATANHDILIQMCQGVTTSSSQHYWGHTRQTQPGGTGSYVGNANYGGYTGISTNVSGVYWGNWVFDFTSPYSGRRTGINCHGSYYQYGYYSSVGTITVDDYNAYDGFNIWSGSTIYGTLRIYGVEQ